MVQQPQESLRTKLELLRQASILIEEQFLKDTYPDLFELYKGRPQEVLTRSALELESASKYKYLKNEGFKALPDSITQHYDSANVRSFMGIMPEISRVWISVDNRLYLWNYDINSNGEVNTFQDQDQTIVNVGICKPLPGIFLEQIEYILVVSTPLEIILLGLAFVDPKSKKGPMTIYRTEMSVSSDGLNMTHVAATDGGRVFMRGNDGQIYELVYQPQDGWLTRKIRKINHSSSGLSLLIPSFLKWGTSDSVASLAIDNSKNVLYAVTKDNQIELTYLGEDGKGFTRISRLSNILGLALRLSDNLPQTPLDERNFKIISIHPISSAESRIINLVAVTETGHRLYFSHTYEFSGNASTVPAPLRLVFARPPPLLSGSLQYNGSLAPKIHQSYYSNGITISTNSFSEEIDRIIGIGLDNSVISQASSKFFCETSSFIDIEGKSWAIAEAPSPQVEAMKKSRQPAGYFLNELVTQFEYPPRMFLVLTNIGLMTVSKQRPLDVLLNLIILTPAHDVRQFQEFAQCFGNDQCCSMSLAIACGHSSISGGAYGVQPHVITAASKLYFDFGGLPAVRQVAPAVIGGRNAFLIIGGMIGVPVSTIDIKYSAKHNGLALYLSRLLRPIWKQELLVKTTKAMPKALVKAALLVEDLVDVQMNLMALDRFLKQYPKFTATPTVNTKPSNIEAEAWKTEQQSTANMHELLIQAIEAIALLSIVMDHSLSNITARLSIQDRDEMRGLTFEVFVSTQRGREIAKSLMAALVNIQIEKDVGVDAIISSLQQRCPTICEGNDVILYKGIELVQSARLTANANQQSKLLREASSLFTSVLKTINFEQLRDIVDSFKSLRFYSGIVDLTLLYASYLDPDDTSQVHTITDVISANKTQPNMHQGYFRCLDCYQLIFTTITSIDLLSSQPSSNQISEQEAQSLKANILSRAVASTDQLFHSCLYEWFIKEGWFDQLLETKSTYLEEYLSQDKRNMQKVDLLWRFYVRNGRFAESAQVLSEIAQSPGLDLSRRLEFLTKAVTNAKSASGVADLGHVQQLLNELTDTMDVAKIQLEILNYFSSAGNEAIAAELNGDILDINMLYHKYARPYQLHDTILLILHVSDQGPSCRPIVEAAWIEILKNAVEEALRKARSPFDTVSDILKVLGRKFYPNDNVFPLRFLVSRLEQLGFEKAVSSVAPTPGWVISVLKGIKVPYNVIFQVYHEIFESKLPPWSSNKALELIITNIALVLEQWLENIRGPAGGAFAREEFPANAIDSSISKYLVSIHPESKAAIRRLEHLQSTVRSHF